GRRQYRQWHRGDRLKGEEEIQKNDDMNKNTLTKMIFGAALLLAAGSCTQDNELGSNTLPEGEYPLQIGSVTLSAEVADEPWGASHAPQTRVAENPDGNSSHWEGGEEITVQLGDKQTTTYEVNSDGSLTLTGEQLYWTKRTDNVTAWFPGNSTIDLSQQTEKLAYVLKAVAENAPYDQTINLDFKHQLSKIRVELTGEKAENVKGVSINSYTSCTNTNGTVSTDKASTGEIAMYRVDDNTYEANVVPGYKIEKFKINGGEWQTLTTGVTPEKGKWHKVTIDVQKKPSTPDEVETISDDGEYLISGTGTKTLTISGGSPTVILQGVNINVTENSRGKPAIAITGGSPTIKIVADNKLESAGSGGIMLSNNASVTITGEGKEKSRLTVKAGGKGDGYGNTPSVGIGAASNGAACGDIFISGVTLDVTAGDCGAAIGTSGHTSSCGNITISNSVIKATGGSGAAAIGMGYIPSAGGPNTVKDIRITSSQVIAIVTDDGWSAIGAGIGMCELIAAYTYTCGKIILDAKSVEELTTFTTDWKVSGTATDKGYKIGKGYYSTQWGTPTVNFGGVCLNGSETVTYSEGWGTW
ncbi:MAG: fimbrillin family protein, partial [Alistipes sp.]|uniref:fimbrillin family protein n=1 Tax=Alistipes sp. TaxID=1872444 RepID=UPI0025C15A83